jgi:broad specificity phosphatase PhoE
MSKKNKTVYFIRHGQSVANPLPLFQGEESELSDLGRQQADKLGDKLAKINPQILITSPYIRARQTCDIIARHTGSRIEYSDLFIERVKPSSIKGMAFGDPVAEKIWSEYSESFYNPDIKIEDGENYFELSNRINRSLDYLLNLEEQSIAVVTHGNFLRTLAMLVLVGSKAPVAIMQKVRSFCIADNASITTVVFRDDYNEEARWRLLSYNSADHLLV